MFACNSQRPIAFQFSLVEIRARAHSAQLLHIGISSRPMPCSQCNPGTSRGPRGQQWHTHRIRHPYPNCDAKYRFSPNMGATRSRSLSIASTGTAQVSCGGMTPTPGIDSVAGVLLTMLARDRSVTTWGDRAWEHVGLKFPRMKWKQTCH